MTSVVSPQVNDVLRQSGPIELGVAWDLAKRGALVSPIFMFVGWLIGQGVGLRSVGLGFALVLANFLLSALVVSAAAKISLGLLMAATLFGFILRFGLIAVAIWLLRDVSGISLPIFGVSMVVVHLGLLLWELRYVKISLAFNGIVPKKK